MSDATRTDRRRTRRAKAASSGVTRVLLLRPETHVSTTPTTHGTSTHNLPQSVLSSVVTSRTWLARADASTTAPVDAMRAS